MAAPEISATSFSTRIRAGGADGADGESQQIKPVTSKRKGQIIFCAFMILLDLVRAELFKANVRGDTSVANQADAGCKPVPWAADISFA